MAKDRAIAGSSLGGKKRKLPPTTITPMKGKRKEYQGGNAVNRDGKEGGMGLMLDDILSTLPSSRQSEKDGVKRGEEVGRVRKKVKPNDGGVLKEKVGVNVKGKESVSTLDLLIGTSGAPGTNKEKGKREQRKQGSAETIDGGNLGKMKKVKTKTNDALELLMGTSGHSSKSNYGDKGKKKKSTTAEEQLSPPPTSPATMFPSTAPPPATPTTTVSTSTSTTLNSPTFHQPQPQPSNPSETPPPPAILHPRLLKTYKSALRILITSLTTLESELVLLDRIWYKNASQFKSTLWWGGIDGARRSLHKLFFVFPSTPTATATAVDVAGKAESELGLAKRTVRNCTLIYALLGGGTEAFQMQQIKLQQNSWPTLPKFNTKPSITMLFFNLETVQLVKTSLTQLKLVGELLKEGQRRTRNAGQILVGHLNTPPAPTFAALITGCLAILARVDGEIDGLVTNNNKEEEEECGAVEVLRSLLNDVNLGCIS